MTKTEKVVEAIRAALERVGLTVRDDTDALYSFESLPCIVIDCGDESPVPKSSSGVIDWDLSVMLIIGADGDVPKLAPEQTRAAAHTALYADRTLGGTVFDLVVGRVSRSISEENPALGITQVTYNLQYRTMEGAI